MNQTHNNPKEEDEIIDPFDNLDEFFLYENRVYNTKLEPTKQPYGNTIVTGSTNQS